MAVMAMAKKADATTLLPQNLEQLEARSAQVFSGVCTGRQAAVGKQNLPVTIYTFRVTEKAKGPIRNGREVVFRQFGNDAPTTEGMVANIPGIPRYEIGQEVVLFLPHPSRLGLAAPVGLSQGVFPVVRDSKGNGSVRLDLGRRKMLTAGIGRKYGANKRFTEAERRLLSDMPEQIDVAQFCTLVRRIGQERERAANAATHGAVQPAPLTADRKEAER